MALSVDLEKIIHVLRAYLPIRDPLRIGQSLPDARALNRLKARLRNHTAYEEIAREFHLSPGNPEHLFIQVCSLARLPITRAATDSTKSIFYSPLKSQSTRGLIISPVGGHIPQKFWLIPFHGSFYILSSIVSLDNSKIHLQTTDLVFRDSALHRIESLDAARIANQFRLSSPPPPSSNVRFLVYNKLFVATELMQIGKVTVSLFRRKPNVINLEKALVTTSLDSVDSVDKVAFRLKKSPVVTDVLSQSRSIVKKFISLFNNTLNHK